MRNLEHDGLERCEYSDAFLSLRIIVRHEITKYAFLISEFENIRQSDDKNHRSAACYLLGGGVTQPQL